ncbi:MAG: hypothetical protein EA358_05755 [Flavobacteriales bacterium]|nr:MAG: hypothetical protein EA358_05755 [Flavobacteriales bacterium]
MNTEKNPRILQILVMIFLMCSTAQAQILFNKPNRAIRIVKFDNRQQTISLPYVFLGYSDGSSSDTIRLVIETFSDNSRDTLSGGAMVDLEKIQIRQSTQVVDYSVWNKSIQQYEKNSGSMREVPIFPVQFYIDIAADFNFSTSFEFLVKLVSRDDSLIDFSVITIVPEILATITFSEFQANHVGEFDRIHHAEWDNGAFTVYGNRRETLEALRVLPDSYGRFSHVFSRFIGGPNTVSLLAVPIKLRAKREVTMPDDNLRVVPAQALSGLNSLGLNFHIYSRGRRTYYLSGKANESVFSLGFMTTFGIESMDSTQLGSYTGLNENIDMGYRLNVSFGLTMNYIFNRVSLTYIPIAIDTPYSSDWIYRGRPWMGFAIGLNLGFLY